MTIWAGEIALDLFLLFAPIAIVFNEKKSLRETFKWLGFKRIRPMELAKKSLMLIALLFIVSAGIALAASALQISDLQNVEKTVRETAANSTMLFAYLLTVRVFCEEVFFRGFLAQKIGVVPSTIIFAAGHFGFGSIVEIIGAFALGMILAVFFEKKQNIFPNMLAHFFYNVSALVMLY